MSRLTSLLFLALLGCSTPPSLKGVEPAEVPPGTEIAVMGDGFADGASLELVAQGHEARALTGVSFVGAVLIKATVPDDTEDGTYDLVIDVGGTKATLPGAITIKAPFVDPPCGGLYTANTQYSKARAVVVIDRFYRDGERETVRTSVGDISGIEYELVKLDDGRHCSIVYLKKNDGTRLRYADDSKVDLKARAYKFANDMGKPIAVTREDAPQMPQAEPAPE